MRHWPQHMYIVWLGQPSGNTSMCAHVCKYACLLNTLCAGKRLCPWCSHAKLEYTAVFNLSHTCIACVQHARRLHSCTWRFWVMRMAANRACQGHALHVMCAGMCRDVGRSAFVLCNAVVQNPRVYRKLETSSHSCYLSCSPMCLQVARSAGIRCVSNK